MGTLSRVLAAWGSGNYKQHGNEYRGHSPLRAGSDGNTFVITATDEEHGTWYDHKTQEGGSLYDLAQRMGIEIERTNQMNGTAKSGYTGLADYAEHHLGIPADVLAAWDWTETEHYCKQRGKAAPALTYPTQGGIRYRMLDGQKPKYLSSVGYKPCWYGLKFALKMIADVPDLPMVLCNGEPSTIVGQYYGVPAICAPGGERRLGDDLIKQLRDQYQGVIWIVFDCDDTGRNAAKIVQQQFQNVGLTAHVIDIELDTNADLADYCRLHGIETLESLSKRIPRTLPMDSHSAALYAIETLSSVPDGKPITFPFRQFHRLGGYADVIMPGKLVGVAAPSGHGKTSFLETITDSLLMQGEHGLYEGKEWKPLEYQARRMQRMGGITYKQWMKHEQYKYDKSRGIADSKNKGIPLTEEQRQDYITKSKKIASWAGKCRYVGQYVYLEDTLADMTMQLELAKVERRPITFAVFDYVNIYKIRSTGSDRSANVTEFAVGLIKDWCITHNLVGFVGVQITKENSENNHTNKLLTAKDIMYARDWQFGLLMTLNILHYENLNKRNPDGSPVWERTSKGIANVLKNSVEDIGQVRLIPAFDRLAWLDEGWMD